MNSPARTTKERMPQAMDLFSTRSMEPVSASATVGRPGADRWRGLLGAALLLALVGCAGVSQQPRVAVYDFGPQAAASQSTPVARKGTIILMDVEAVGALEGNALMYRLGYADAQQLRPYAQARWGMPPAQLLRQRLREQLSQRRAVLAPGDAPPGSQPTLRVELDEFSHYFDAPNSSVGLVRARATLVYLAPGGERVAQQTQLLARQSADTADAAGGTRALAAASDALVAQLEQWLQKSLPEPAP